jgi:hypothetical protein
MWRCRWRRSLIDHRRDLEHEQGQEHHLPRHHLRQHGLQPGYKVESSYGKSSVQGATIYIAYGSGKSIHDWKYEILDTLPSAIMVNSADSIDIVGNVVKHSGNEGISMINDVINSNIIGNYVTDIAGSGMTIGHPQHVYLGDGGAHEKFAKGVEGYLHQDHHQQQPRVQRRHAAGFGSHAGVTAFFTDTVSSRITTSTRSPTMASTWDGDGVTSRTPRPARTTPEQQPVHQYDDPTA